MSNARKSSSAANKWAQLRFAIVGPLLAAPPKRGELQDAITQLANKTWVHPTDGTPTRFGASTIERWYYRAKNERRDPVGALRTKHRKDTGTQPSLHTAARQSLQSQYRDHPRWSYQLHYDNLCALAKEDPELSTTPSYSTVRRFMKSTGLLKTKRRSSRITAGTERARKRLERFEVRSYEASHVHGLWHLDFHVGSRKIITPAGEWVDADLFGVIDDRSRLCCHLQWYFQENAENLIHGLSQAIQKRALPRALMTDNGGAMLAAETVEGLAALGIIHDTTLSESPYQNGKQETFWAQVEGRLMAMLENVDDLTLALLNEATCAWVELEYNKKRHQEIGTTPVRRYLEGPEVGRASPDSLSLRKAFRQKQMRTQRRSDGTLSIEGRRFEVPSRFRHIEKLLVAWARWDLGHVDIIDPNTLAVLSPLYPLDKEKNADGLRRKLAQVKPKPSNDGPPKNEVAPLLRDLMRRYAETGLPPAYLPKHLTQQDKE